MKIRYSLILLSLAATVQIRAQLSVYRTLGEKQIQVTASSSWFGAASPANLINLSGIQGMLHDNEMSAGTMWHTAAKPVASRANPGTHAGPAWVLFRLDQAYPLKELLIWNHNQPEYTKRGFKNVIIEYSADGVSWREVRPAGPGSWVIPAASAVNGEPVSLAAPLGGITAQYIALTAAPVEGNWGDEIYGLSEVLFVTSEKLNLNESITIAGTDKLYQGTPPTREFSIEFNQGIGYGTDNLQFTTRGTRLEVVANPDGGPVKLIPVRVPYQGFDKPSEIVIADQKGTFQKTITVNPPREWNIYLFTQSHVDIGYTDYPEKVSGVYHKNIKNAIELARKTANYPEGSRYRWNMEVLWPVETYLQQATASEKAEFAEAVRKGWINLDAAYASINTSLCNGEQLNRLFEYGDSLEQTLGIRLDATQQVDVPGASWGIAESMKQSGVEFFLDLPNYMDDNYQENRPFLWKNPSATGSILHFQTYYYNLGYHLKGRYIPNYLQGNTDPVYKENADQYFLDPFIFGFLDGLKKKDYPYHELPLAWTMTDNAALDPDLPDVVKRWNEKFMNPRVIISTPSDFYHDFIKKNKAIIPVLTGDYTEYWTNGVASGSMETRANRHNTEDILTLETLYGLTGRSDYNPGFFSFLWKQILLFTEHTWGSYKSATDFADPYVYGQWKVKADYALKARVSLDSLMATFRGDTHENQPVPAGIKLINTQSWERAEPFLINGVNLEGSSLTGPDGKPVPMQKVGNGSYLAISSPVPAFSGVTYRVTKKVDAVVSGLQVTTERISNRFYSVEKRSPLSLVISDRQTGKEVFRIGNDYCRYIKDLDPQTKTSYGKITAIEPGVSGALTASMRVHMEVPGFKNFVIEVSLIDGVNQVEVVNRFDKLTVTDKEKVSFNFGFTVAGGRTLFEIPWGVVDPDKDLIRGSNKTYFTIGHFADLSNDREGVTLVAMDAPILQITPSGADPRTIYESVVVDNGWHTNFPATQSGPMEFRYVIRTHGAFHLPETVKWGNSLFQPLVALPNPDLKVTSPFRKMELGEVITTSLRKNANGSGWVMRLYNPSDRKNVIDLQPLELYRLNLDVKGNNPVKRTGNQFELLPKEVITIELLKK